VKWLALIAMTALTVLSYWVAPAKSFPEPELARVIFFHLPSAFVATVFVIFASVCAWRYLMTRQWIWEFRSLAATEIALAASVATMLTGILFSKVQWGAWWHWDPRQTSFLIVLLILGAYFAIRMAYEEETARARVAASYSSLTLLPIIFLIFVFPRLPQVNRNSLHPSTTIQSGGFSTDYWTIVLGIFITLLGICIWLYRMHVRISLLEQQLKDRDGNLENSRRPASTHRVDRVLPLHE
jgi:heme exporter protein C